MPLNARRNAGGSAGPAVVLVADPLNAGRLTERRAE